MECKKCGATIPDDGIFCLNCGSRVDGKKACPKCEKLIPEKSLFCTYCGQRLLEEEHDKKEPENQVETEEKEVLSDASVIVPTEVPSNSQETVVEKTETDKIIAIDEEKVETPSTNSNIQKVEDFDGVPVSFYELPIEIKKEEFFAELLTSIALKKDSPEDFFTESKFDPVETIYCQYLIGSANVDMSYSATIGYDRQETYYKTVKENGVQKKIEQTRTVTDWQPFSSTYKDSLNGMADNDNQEGTDVEDYYSRCKEKSMEYDVKNSKGPAPLPPTNKSIKDLKFDINLRARNDCELSLPGDQKKDFRCSGVVDLTAIESHVAPRYVLEYAYDGKKFKTGKHPVKESRIDGEFPSVKEANEKEIENDKVVKSVNIATFCTLLFAILSAILIPIVILKIIFMLVSIVMFITNCVVKSKVSKQIYVRKQSRKKTELIALLKKKGIEIPKELKEGVQK